jgi:hypothetical protein
MAPPAGAYQAIRPIHVTTLRRSALGTSGAKSRKHASDRRAIEPARLAVTKGVGNAIDNITAMHPVLGAHLKATVRRGYFCSYTPDPRHPIVWRQ